MALPLIFPPAGTPQFIVEGHSRTPEPVYDDVPMLVGHGRKQRVYTVAPQTVTVAWILDTPQMLAVDNWFEITLHVGDLTFTAQIGKVGMPTVEYWTAQWVEPYVAEPLPGGWWRVTGALLLTGAPTDARPSTGVIEQELFVDLLGSARVFGPSAIEQEIAIALGGARPIASEIRIDLDSLPYELRDDGGFELRDDGSRELRDY